MADHSMTLDLYSWNSTGKIGRIGRHLAEKPDDEEEDVDVTMCLGPMPPNASDFPGGLPAYGSGSLEKVSATAAPPSGDYTQVRARSVIKATG